MFKEILLVLKKDLSFHLTEEEQALSDKMTEGDFQKFRTIMLERVKCGELPLDVLEEYLEREKEHEKIACFKQKGIDNVEDASRIEEELDARCSRMLIGIIKAIKNNENHILLDSNVEEFVGARSK